MNTPSHASSVAANQPGSRARVANWLDRQAPFVFVLPTVLLILAFSIFPLVTSAYLSLTRFELGEGGYQLTFTGLRNYVRLFSGSQQYHFTGVFRAPGIVSIATIVIAVLAVIVWFYRYFRSDGRSIMGTLGRSISASAFLALVWLAANTLGGGGALGSLMVTIFYVVLGVALQFFVGLGLAYLCTLTLQGGRFFRLLFFLPLVVAFNLVGTVDILVDYYHGTQLGLPALAGELGATYAIPILYVPLLMITHAVALYWLLRPLPQPARTLASGVPAA